MRTHAHEGRAMHGVEPLGLLDENNAILIDGRSEPGVRELAGTKVADRVEMSFPRQRTAEVTRPHRLPRFGVSIHDLRYTKPAATFKIQAGGKSN
jgi:hypothetical protein